MFALKTKCILTILDKSIIIGTFFNKNITNCVPAYTPVTNKEIESLDKFFKNAGNLLVLTGAGISTESGIPDYRSKFIGLYERSSRRPISYQEFMNSAHRRKHYWLRNYVGWPKFSSHKPNTTHKILYKMENNRKLSHIITQNVDNLHYEAGNTFVTELHGSTFRVVCVNCHYSIQRHDFQITLEKLNRSICLNENVIIRPDGDVEISEDQADKFNIPDCPNCGGILKPDVVFFGDNVPKNRTDLVKMEVLKCDSLLILGSTLSVFSAYRIVLQTAELHKPIAIINIGKTRADYIANLKIQANCSEILSKIKFLS